MEKQFLTRLIGPVGCSIVSVASLWIWMYISGNGNGPIFEMTLALVVVRLLHSQITAKSSFLSRVRFRNSPSDAISEETLMAISFLAACYLLQWTVALSDVIGFVAFNMLLQIALVPLSRTLRLSLQKCSTIESSLNGTREALIVGTGPQAVRAADVIIDSVEVDATVAGFLDYDRRGMWGYRDIPFIGHPDEIERIVATRQVDFVVVAVEPPDLPRTASLLAAVERMGVTACIMSQVFVPSLARIGTAKINGSPVVEFVSAPMSSLSTGLKNMIDRLGALTGLILSAPVMLLTAIAIKMDSPGPVFFRQTRSGINGRPFKLWKFRTMETDAESKRASLQKKNEMSGPVFKISNDPRVTRIGRHLRKYSIDELPQFLNVLLGEMSLVGPRPALPSEVAEFKPWQHRKLSVKPGLTCLWQANGRNKIDFEDWMRMDLQYIDNWSLWEDTKIVAKTIPTVLRGSGK